MNDARGENTPAEAEAPLVSDVVAGGTGSAGAPAAGAPAAGAAAPPPDLPAAGIYGRGLLMGVADVIPGVSGGTIAFILGIYPRFIEALSRMNLAWILPLLRAAFASGEARRAHWALAKARLELRHVRFLACLVSGMGSAIVAGSMVMPWLLEHYPAGTYAFFFGLILASVPIPWAAIPQRGATQVALACAAAALTYWFVGLPAIRTTEARWFLAPSGAIAICAMVLPGISGSYVLLMLGRYPRVIGATRDLVKGLAGQGPPGALEAAVLDLLVFNAGVIAGVLSFARTLRYLLREHAAPTLAVLVGVMIGALRSVWPFRERVVDASGHVVTREALPRALDGEVLGAAVFFFVGVATLVGVEWLGRRRVVAEARATQPGQR